MSTRPAATRTRTGGKRAAASAGRASARTGARRAAASAAEGPERLWAPWRMRWLEKAAKPGGCLFCRVAAAREDRRDLVLARRPHALLMLNRYPYAGGHLMAAVRRHAAAFHELTPAEGAELLELVALAERALGSAMRPDGFNLGVNLGRVAGAGFPGHLHVHVVPRWDGDTNFMPVTALTRVLPEALPATWAKLRRAIASLERPARKARPRGASRRGPA